MLEIKQLGSEIYTKYIDIQPSSNQLIHEDIVY